jgi:hypothetical protein
VIAINTTYDASSAPSAQVSAVPLPPVPGVPTNVAAVAGSLQITVSWTGSANATGYQLERSATSGGPYTTLVATVPETTATTYSFTDTGRIAGKTYYYIVIAVNSTYSTSSADSAQVSATPTD